MTGVSASPPIAACPHSRGFDPYGDAFRRDPASAVSDEPSIFYSPLLGYYVVTSHADIRAICRDEQTFSVRRNGEPVTPLSSAAVDVLADSGFQRTTVLGVDDSPQHMMRRKLLREPFIPESVERREPRVREVFSSYIDRIVTAGHADLVAQVLREAPAVVALEFMGVPGEDVDQLKRSAEGTLDFLFGRPSAARQVAMCEQAASNQAYARALVDRLLDHDDEDSPGLLAHAVRVHRGHPEVFDRGWLVGLATTTMAAAHETTTGALAGALLILLSEQRSSWEALCARPELARSAAEECLRVCSPVSTIRRECRRDTVLGGVRIPAGAMLLLVIGAANRDEDAFADSHRFELQRADARRHVAFGFGAHMCIGAPLARLQIRVGLQELSRRLPHMRLRDGSERMIEWPENLSAHAPRSLPVEWDPASNPVPADRPAVPA